MAEKVTIMVLKVDLQCSHCYKKIKKILCKFHQKIRDKLWCKGGKLIQCIEIKEPPKPKVAETTKKPEQPKPAEKPKPAEEPPKVDPPPKAPEPPPKAPEPVQGYPPVFPIGVCCGPCSEGYTRGPCYHGCGRPRLPSPPPPPVRDCCGPCSEGYTGGPCYHRHGRARLPSPPPSPVRDCCGPCSEGYTGGPCYHDYGRPPQPPPCYIGYSYGYCYCGRGCNMGRCDWSSEEDPSACTVM